MLIGLVTEQMPHTRKSWLIRLFRITTYKKIASPQNGFVALLAELPYSIKWLERQTPQRLERLMVKTLAKLEKQASKQVLSEYLKKLCQSKGVLSEKTDNYKARRLFLRLSSQCIRQTAKKCGIRLIDAVVCIRDTKMDRISEYLLKELCYDVNNIVVCTKNQAGAKAICESFYDETGLLVRILDTDDFVNSDIMVDVDEAFIKFGRDLYVTGADLGFDFKGLYFNHFEIAHLINKKDFEKIKWIYSYE